MSSSNNNFDKYDSMLNILVRETLKLFNHPLLRLMPPNKILKSDGHTRINNGINQSLSGNDIYIIHYIFHELILDTSIFIIKNVLKKIEIDDFPFWPKNNCINMANEINFCLLFWLDFKLYTSGQNDYVRNDLYSKLAGFLSEASNEDGFYSILDNRINQYATLINKGNSDVININLGKFTAYCIAYSMRNNKLYEPEINSLIIADVGLFICDNVNKIDEMDFSQIIGADGIDPLEMACAMDIYSKALLPSLCLFTKKVESLSSYDKNIFEINEDTARNIIKSAETKFFLGKKTISDFESLEWLQ